MRLSSWQLAQNLSVNLIATLELRPIEGAEEPGEGPALPLVWMASAAGAVWVDDQQTLLPTPPRVFSSV